MNNQTYEKLCEYERSAHSGDANVVPPDVNADAQYELKGGKLVKHKSNSKKPPSRLERRFDVMTYIPPAYVDQFLRDQEWIQHWAYCHHDSDRWSPDDEKENAMHKAGELKRAHTHIVLYTFNRKSSSAICKIFNRYAQSICNAGEMPENTRCLYCDDVVRSWRYLLHLDECIDDYTVLYKDSCRFCDNYNYWSRLEIGQGLNDSDKNKALAMVEDYIAGVKHYDMLKRYGHYYLQNFYRVRDMGNQVCIDLGLPIPCCAPYGKDKLDYDMMLMFLSASSFTAQEQATFFMILQYISNKCFVQFGSPVDMYLSERN